MKIRIAPRLHSFEPASRVGTAGTALYHVTERRKNVVSVKEVRPQAQRVKHRAGNETLVRK